MFPNSVATRKRGVSSARSFRQEASIFTFLGVLGLDTGEWTLGVLVLTLAGVLWYSFEARRQAEATARIAAETERHNRRSLRPLLDIILETFPTDDGGEYGSYVMVTVKNVGSGPAIDILARQPSEPEIGFQGGVSFLGSLAVGQSITNRAVSLLDECVLVEYLDFFGDRHRSTRALQIDPLPLGSGYIYELGQLEVAVGVTSTLSKN